MHGWRFALVPVVALGLLVGCGDDDDSTGTDSSSTSVADSTGSTASELPTSSAPPPSSTLPADAPEPGSACELGSDPDCIDPDGNGQGTYLIGGADCMADLADTAPELCSDLDADGNAGYPDSG